MSRTADGRAPSTKRLRLLGKAIRDTRTRLGMTQAELGAPLLTKGFISQVEKGLSAASIESLFHIAARLQMPPARLLAMSDPEHLIAAALDMAEAALMLRGPEAGGRWLARLPQLMDEAETPVAVIIEQISASGRRAEARLLRYRALAALRGGHPATAVRLLQSSLSGAGQWEDGAGRFWLGEACRRAGRLREAMLAWERLLVSEAGPPWRTAGARRLAALYELLGDEAGAAHIRKSLLGPTPYGHGADRDGVPAGGRRQGELGAGCAGAMWSMACHAWRHGDLASASAYARPIPLCLLDFEAPEAG